MQNKVATYLIESNVPFDYIDELQYDAYLMTVSRGNIKIIKLLKEKYINLFRIYNIDSKQVTALSFINEVVHKAMHIYSQFCNTILSVLLSLEEYYGISIKK